MLGIRQTWSSLCAGDVACRRQRGIGAEEKFIRGGDTLAATNPDSVQCRAYLLQRATGGWEN